MTNFYLTPWVLFGFNYAVLKFESTGDTGNAGAIFKQLYFRQALQSLVDQPNISKVLKGYGVPTYGPVPCCRRTPASTRTRRTTRIRTTRRKAKSLLSSHGWKVVPDGTDTCQKPGTGSSECGAGIPKGAQLSFTLVYPSGTQWQQQAMDVEQSAWNAIGINDPAGQ